MQKMNNFDANEILSQNIIISFAENNKFIIGLCLKLTFMCTTTTIFKG